MLTRIAHRYRPLQQIQRLGTEPPSLSYSLCPGLLGSLLFTHVSLGINPSSNYPMLRMERHSLRVINHACSAPIACFTFPLEPPHATSANLFPAGLADGAATEAENLYACSVCISIISLIMLPHALFSQASKVPN